MTEISSSRSESDLSHSHHLRADRLCLALTPGKRREGHMSASVLNKWKPLMGRRGRGDGGVGRGPNMQKGQCLTLTWMSPLMVDTSEECTSAWSLQTAGYSSKRDTVHTLTQRRNSAR